MMAKMPASVARRTVLVAGAAAMGNVLLSSTAAHGSAIKNPTVTLIAVDSWGLRFFAGTSLVNEFNYFQDNPNSVISALRSALGRGEKIKEVDGGNHPSHRQIAWSGFALLDFKRGSGSFLNERFSVDVSSSKSSGVEIEASDGVAVGNTAGSLDQGRYTKSEDAVTGAVSYYLDARDVDTPSPATPSGAQLFVAALVDEGTVSHLCAPRTNWGV